MWYKMKITWQTVAWTLASCINPSRIWEDWRFDNFYTHIKSLDWQDPWQDFIQTDIRKYLSPEMIDQLKRDSALWWLPIIWENFHSGVFSNILNIDKNSFYIARDKDWNIIRNEKWRAMYRYHKDWSIVDFDKLWFKRDRKTFNILWFDFTPLKNFRGSRSNPLFWLFTKKSKKMFIAPIWYWWIKRMMQHYIDFLVDKKYIRWYQVEDDKWPHTEYKWELSTEWIELLQKSLDKYFEDIESWYRNRQRPWWEDMYSLFTWDWWNHWMFLSKVMYTNFSRIISDNAFAKRILWFDIWLEDWVTFRQFAESAAAFADRGTGWNITVLDILWEMWQQKYWAKITKHFEVTPTWKVERLEEPATGFILTKDYLMRLDWDQQLEEVAQLWDEFVFSKRQLINMKLKKWVFKFWWFLVRFVNFIWRPWVMSAFMSLAKFPNSLMSLLTLNSTMFFTEKMAMWTRLDWDWKSFMSKYWLSSHLDHPEWFEQWVWNWLLDSWLKAYEFTVKAFQQWLFNVWDLLMQDSYKIKQYQAFFELTFPWIKSLDELSEALDSYRLLKWEEEFEILLSSARWYVEKSVRNATTNTNIRQSNIKLNAAKNVYMQPYKDLISWMRNFFAWWWNSKQRWAFNIIKDWVWNLLHWRIWATYIDELLKSDLSPAQIDAYFKKAFLENEDFLYFMNRVYYSFVIAKFLSRLEWDDWEKDDWWLFDWYWDFMDFFKLFNGEIAAFESTPYWRVIETYLSTLKWELDNWESLWYASVEATFPAVKELIRSFFRKLYMWQIATEIIWEYNNEWMYEERDFLTLLWKAIQDNTTWFLYYLKDEIEQQEFSYWIPKWPNQYLRSILWLQEKNIAYAKEQKDLAKYVNLISWWYSISNRFLWNMPFTKQYNIGSEIAKFDWFLDDMDSFRATKAYQSFANNTLPSDLTDHDWKYIYYAVTWRLQSSEVWDINRDTLYTKYDYWLEDPNKENWWWQLVYNKERQIQEKIVHTLMSAWLSEKQSKRFTSIMKDLDSKYVDEAVRTLAYAEENTPWAWMQCLAYIMNSEWVRKVYWNVPKDRTEAQIKQAQENAMVEISKKYAKYIPYVDKYYTYTQIMLNYAKEHDTSIAKYIWTSSESWMWKMKMIVPWTEDQNWWKSNNQLLNNFKARLMVDILWAQWDCNAHELMNWFATIFDTQAYELPWWWLEPHYASYVLKQVANVYDHIDWLALNEEVIHKLKQWALMFGDSVFPYILKDEELMKRSDVQNVVNDWVHYWYKEFRELNDIATEYAEDQIANAEYKKYWKKRWKWYYPKNVYNWWANKKYPGFDNWYNKMKNRAYSPDYTKYRNLNWMPNKEKDYLSEADFYLAKMRLDNVMGRWTSKWPLAAKQKKWSWWWKWQDDWIWVSTRRWKSIKFVKQEDINKPVEYKTPRRKRWVKKWNWNDAITTTTWKHLSPTVKKW